MTLLSTADSFMCNRKDQNEKVSVGVVIDKTRWPDLTMHSEDHIDLSAGISLLTHKSTKQGAKWHLGYH